MSNYVISNTQPSPPDLRDIPYRSPFALEDLPSSVDLRADVFEVEHQGSIGSCVANGVASSCELLANRNNKPIDLSRMFLYNATKAYEGRLGEEGLFTRDAYHIAYKYGIPTEEYYPYDLSKDDIDPPLDAYNEAFANRVNRYETLSGTQPKVNRYGEEADLLINKIKAALHEGLPVGMACQVMSDLSDLVGPWQLHSYPRDFIGSKGIGGHFMLIVGYDDQFKRFIVQNSWGTGYGDGGYCGLPYSIVGHPWFEAWVIRSFKDMEVPEPAGVRLESISKWGIDARLIPEKDEIGSTVKVWIAAMNANGDVYVKKPVESLDDSIPEYRMPDVWKPMEDGGLIPAVDDYVLDSDNYIKIIRFVDISGIKDVDVYVGYGQDVQSMRISKVVSL